MKIKFSKANASGRFAVYFLQISCIEYSFMSSVHHYKILNQNKFLLKFAMTNFGAGADKIFVAPAPALEKYLNRLQL